VGYPLALALWARLRPAPVTRAPFRGRVSLIMAVRNEEANIERRLAEMCRHLRESGLDGEMIVISDGSTDRTAELARQNHHHGLVRVLEVPENVGKAAAISHGCLLAKGDVLVFADARQTWADDALPRLLESFADPAVGAVSGNLVLEAAPGVLAGVGLYWRFEKWLRRTESLVNSQVGVTGAISAVRRELFRPIPAGILLDDVYWPLQVSLQGWRVVHDDRARAFDRLPAQSRDEFRRKVRTLAGNFQLAARMPQSLLPWRNPVWLSWISHKLLRLVMPWALLGMLASSCFLPHPAYQAFFVAQTGSYLIARLGLVPALGRNHKLLGAAGSFLVLNAASWLAFWVWLTGHADRFWTKVRYGPLDARGELTPQNQ
jgi:cellulose synthase/poly-beta-1,6-N-acetylglucosamine synthase-like glycosyltransferase